MQKFLAAFIAVVLIVLSSTNLHSENSPLYIQVKQSSLRDQPRYWGKVIANLEYGAPLTAISTADNDKSWLRVKSGEQEGYVHVGSVTKRKITLSAGNKNYDRKVDTLSVSLAGKGFNSKVEKMYASSKGLDYSVVDAVESYRVNNDEFYAFLNEGKLNEK
jgi:hypothetical protein